MTVPHVVNGQVIEDDWGNAVADDVNGHETRIDVLEARIGIWLGTWAPFAPPIQTVGDTVTTYTGYDATVQASAGWAVAAGVVTVPAGGAGVYSITGSLMINSGNVQVVALRIGDGVNAPRHIGMPVMGGLGGAFGGETGGGSILALSAGWQVSIVARSVSGSIGATAGVLQIWKVAP